MIRALNRKTKPFIRRAHFHNFGDALSMERLSISCSGHLSRRISWETSSIKLARIQNIAPTTKSHSPLFCFLLFPCSILSLLYSLLCFLLDSSLLDSFSSLLYSLCSPLYYSTLSLPFFKSSLLLYSSFSNLRKSEVSHSN